MKVLTENKNFDLGDHHVPTSILSHTGEMPPPWVQCTGISTMDQIEHIMKESIRYNKELFRLHFVWTNISEQQVKIYLILCFYVLIIMCFYVRIFNISHICDVIKLTCGQRFYRYDVLFQ